MEFQVVVVEIPHAVCNRNFVGNEQFKMENVCVFRLSIFVNTTEGKCQIEKLSDGRGYKLESNLDSDSTQDRILFIK